jgi:hypothetical protein
VTISARRAAGGLSYRVLIAAAVPILWLTLASFGRTGATAGEITVRRPTVSGPAPRLPVPDVQLAQEHPTQPISRLAFSRNPFAFAPRSLSPPPVPSPVSMAAPPAALPDLPSSVALSLIGVATTTRGDGRTERTAIIAGPGDALYLVRETDAVMARYRVDAVLPDSVLLVDGATGASLRLQMR